MSGTLYGIGIGPGDPELLTLKAARLIEHCPVVCYIRNHEGYSLAREIAAAHLHGQLEVPMEISMGKARVSANQAYDLAAEQLKPLLAEGSDVAVLCEGDPMFYGSFCYLLERLQTHARCEVVPGITSVSTVAARTLNPLTLLNQRLAVVTGRNHDDEILAALNNYDCIAILKAGPERPRLLQLLRQSGRWQDGCYVTRATQTDEQIWHNLDELPAEKGDYFGLMLITRSDYHAAGAGGGKAAGENRSD